MMKSKPISGLFRSVVVLASGTAAAQTILLLSAPLLTRLYSPDQFGFLAAYMASVTIIGALSTLRFELVVPLPRRDDVAINALALTLICVFTTAVCSALVFWQMAEQLAVWLNLPNLPKIAWLVPIGVFSIGTYTALSNWAVRIRRFGLIARTKLTQAIGQTLFQIAAAFSPFATLGLLIGNLFGQSAGITSFAREIKRQDVNLLSKISLKRVWFLARHYWRFPVFSAPGSVAFSAGQQAPSLALLFMFGPASAGFFLLAQRVGMLPATLIGTAISQSIFRNLAISKKDPHEVGRAVAAPVRLMSELLIGPAVFLAFLAPRVVGLVFGPEWVDAGLYLSWMAPWVAASIIFGAMSPIVSVLGLQKLGLFFQVSSLAVSLAALYYAGSAWGPVAAIAGYSMAKTASILVYRLHMFRLVGISPRSIVTIIVGQSVIYLALFGAAVALVNGETELTAWRSLLGMFLLCVGAVIYGFVAIRGIKQAREVPPEHLT